MKGCVVEPLPDMFAKLRAAYEHNTAVAPLQLALHKSKSTCKIFRPDPAAPNLPAFVRGIASFDPNHWRRSVDTEVPIVEEEVECVTWEALLARCAVNQSQLDLLQIDTEGYDFEILSMIELIKSPIPIIRFEHGVGRGVMSKSQLRFLYNTFKGAGYTVAIGLNDATAVHQKAF